MDSPERWRKSFEKIVPSLRKIVRTAILTRTETSNEGTFGLLATDSGFQCYTGEDPWRGNAKDISCVPELVVIVQRIVSPKHGPCYCLTDVPGGRTMCEIHKGNWCGDRAKGFKSDVEGCLIVGNAIGSLAGQACVLNSKDALERLEADHEYLPFQLTIRWQNGINPETSL